MSEYSFTKFTNVTSDALSSQSRINSEKDSYLSFGVSFLDDALVGIAKTDLIVLGGRSGGGKTELATHIAMTNALKKKRVYFFALEAEDKEISDRIKYKVLANIFFSARQKRYAEKYIAYDRWKAGLLEKEFAPFEEFANQAMAPLENLKVRYGSENYALADYEKDLLEIKDDAELIIIDHLHYFDIDETQANAEIKTIVKKIKALAMEHGVPVILISHIRKQDKKYANLVPDQEDFHGSSDIIKIATKSITIASGFNKKCLMASSDGKSLVTFDLTGLPSFIRAVKNRRNGGVTYSIGLLQYDASVNNYLPGYILGEEKYEKGESYFLALQKDSVPLWAESSQNK